MSYLQERLNALQITDENNGIYATNIDNKPQQFHFFSENKNGDIVINYLDLNGKIVYYGEGENQRNPKPFARIRYEQPKDPKRKYYQPEKTKPYPFCTPSILKMYKEKAECKTLFVTEGEFKAFVLSNFNLPCFGIGGIHNFKTKEKDSMHPYILDFIKECKVRNVILLFDADCLKVEWEEGKDLATRLINFHAAVTTFNELLKNYNVTVYFSHVYKESEFKGIDDLLYNGICEQNTVIQELTSLTEGANQRKYINTYKITGISYTKIQKIFWLDNVQSFFDNNSSQLENKDFVYKGTSYYVDENGKVVSSWKGELKLYIRVGTDYYKKTVDISSKGIKELNLTAWNTKEFSVDFDDSKLFKRQIPKYDGFANEPENDPEKFKQTIVPEKDGIKSVLYNRYIPITHELKEGEWNNINKLLHHIFDYKNTSGEPLYEFAIDYLQLLYMRPIEKLPVICLVSKENKTGKTTFLNLLQNIFLENMRIIDNARIESKFNGSYIGKLIVAIDETLIEIKKEDVKNRIRAIATNDNVSLEEKYGNAKQVSNISKLIMCSNRENNFMKIDEEENRYCVIKVPTLKDTEDRELLEKMTKEIPAFLYFLKNRKLHYEAKTRLYFDEKVFETPQLKHIMERTQDRLEQNVNEVIKEQFFMQQKDVIRLSLSILTKLVQENYRFADKSRISNYLNDSGYKVKNSSPCTYKIDYETTDKFRDRYYELSAKDFLNENELIELESEKRNAMNEGIEFPETHEAAPFE